jgi:uncharacterized repeat protein (TIGR01451 family)
MQRSHIALTRILFLIIVCLVTFPAGLSAADTDDDSDPVVIEVQDSIESFLEAVAINGQSIPPTANPETELGDVVTFRVRLRNTFPGTLKLLQCGADWGGGFSYLGNLTGNHVVCRYDAPARKIIADIEELPEETGGSSGAGVDLGETVRWYTFDLKAMECKNLSVNIYTDELYSCESVKTYYAAARITTPEIRYAVSLSQQKIIAGQKQEVIVTISNIGDGRANGFVLETNLEKTSAIITGISAEFIYDREAGAFVAEGPIAPGQSIILRFNLEMNKGARSPLPKGGLAFNPSYTDNCGIRLQSPEQIVALSGAGEKKEEIVGIPDLTVRVSPECCRLEPGEVLPWVVYITNRGNAEASDVMLEDVLSSDDLLFQPAGSNGNAPQVQTDKPAPGKTTLAWNLGDIPPSQTRKVSVAALARENKDDPAGIADISTIRVYSGREQDASSYEGEAMPGFIMPEECLPA